MYIIIHCNEHILHFLQGNNVLLSIQRTKVLHADYSCQDDNKPTICIVYKQQNVEIYK